MVKPDAEVHGTTESREHARENLVVFSKVEEHRIRNLGAIACRRAVERSVDAQECELVRPFNRQRTQQHLVDNGEDGRVRADAEREGKYCRRGKPWRPSEQAASVSQVLGDRGQPLLAFDVTALFAQA